MLAIVARQHQQNNFIYPSLFWFSLHPLIHSLFLLTENRKTHLCVDKATEQKYAKTLQGNAK